MRGNLSELLMIKVPEIYHKYITVNKKGETVLYVGHIWELHVLRYHKIRVKYP